MFKKKPQIKTLSPLRSSDRRRTADKIIAEHKLTPKQSDDDAVEDKTAATEARTALRNSLLPDNALSAKFTTTSGPNLKEVFGTVYVGSHDGSEQRVLWFSIEDKLYPTVYTLWRNPGILPLLHTPSMVVQKLQGGADLMTPGLAGPPFPSGAEKGAVVAIASLNNPSVPVALGVCEIDVSALTETRGAKGHAVKTVHWSGDELWDWSASGKPGTIAPETLEGWLDNVADDVRHIHLDENDDDGDHDDVDEGGVSLIEADEGSHAVGMMKNGLSSKADLAEVVDIPEHNMTEAEINSAFKQAFLYGVHYHKEADPDQPKHGLNFPLSQSSVMSNLVLPFLPAFTPKQVEALQIKKTSWKNIRKFIKFLEKQKLVLAKERPGNEVDILDIDFEDTAFKDFQPYKLPKKGTQSSTTNANTTADSGPTGDDAIGQRLKRVELYKPERGVVTIFKNSGNGSKAYYTSTELRSTITTYIESQNLISTSNKRLVILDPTLSNALFPSNPTNIDAEILARGSIPRDALIDRFVNACSPYHTILRNDADIFSAKPRAGVAPKIEIILETRSGNKTATRVHGLEDYFIRAQPLADELRKTCAGSTSVEPWKAGGKDKMEVMVQGPQRDAVVKALEKRGVDKRWIEVVDKTKGKKK